MGIVKGPLLSLWAIPYRKLCHSLYFMGSSRHGSGLCPRRTEQSNGDSYGNGLCMVHFPYPEYFDFTKFLILDIELFTEDSL